MRRRETSSGARFFGPSLFLSISFFLSPVEAAFSKGRLPPTPRVLGLSVSLLLYAISLGHRSGHFAKVSLD
jgi:hypothetical protein